MSDPIEVSGSTPLTQRLLRDVSTVLVEHTPGDDHLEPAVRKAVAAALRSLADGADSYNPELTLHMHQRRKLRALADSIEKAV